MEEITITGYEGADMLDLINDEMEGKEEHKELGLEWKKIYRTGKDFLSEFGNGSVELNHCIHYSIREYKDKETGNGTNKYFGEFLILNQKRSTLTSVLVKEIKNKETDAIYKYLSTNWKRS